ncbi:hypothetical protein GGS23DRAFT_559007 [Durotheca rogersii]|uniref:uncharacterized protein n=1 Tax=Durotheca rogersii TaxID=419775 RepID=UPI00221FECC2|nr:uncharacterized protein GGS23DRAFT_559007 [Durotheca rogersii]KAI5865390.1 hypothetical protein GGS23DRAFT_559007 [Durotheca rogersii]
MTSSNGERSEAICAPTPPALATLYCLINCSLSLHLCMPFPLPTVLSIPTAYSLLPCAEPILNITTRETRVITSTTDMSGKAPSEGTKVTAGKDAPVTREGPGIVTEDSLAAESRFFRQANEAAPQHISPVVLTAPSNTPQSGAHNPTAKQGDRNAAAAPSYVQSQYASDPSGPHGRNVREDDDIGTDGRYTNASFSEFGTRGDPGRAAEQKFTHPGSVNAGTTAGREKRVDDDQPFIVLGSDAQA